MSVRIPARRVVQLVIDTPPKVLSLVVRAELHGSLKDYVFRMLRVSFKPLAALDVVRGVALSTLEHAMRLTRLAMADDLEEDVT